jgi:hypothetical protein
MSFNVASLSVGYSDGQDRSSRSEQKHVPTPIRRPDQQPESDRPAAEKHIERAAPERAEAGRLGDAAPEIL